LFRLKSLSSRLDRDSRTSLDSHRRFSALSALLSVRPNTAGSIRRHNRGRAKGREVWRLSKTMTETPAGGLYAVRFRNAIYVLHAFQKESPHGIATRQSDVALVKERLRLARRDYEEKYG